MVLVQILLWTQTLPQPLPSSHWVSFETWTSDTVDSLWTFSISMLWTCAVMKKLYWIRKVDIFSHWSQAVYCDLDRWSYFYSVCTCFSHSIRLSSKKIEQLSRKRSVPKWHSHIISSVDISSQAAAGEMLAKRRYSIKPLSYIEKSVLLNRWNGGNSNQMLSVACRTFVRNPTYLTWGAVHTECVFVFKSVSFRVVEF